MTRTRCERRIVLRWNTFYLETTTRTSTVSDNAIAHETPTWVIALKVLGYSVLSGVVSSLFSICLAKLI